MSNREFNWNTYSQSNDINSLDVNLEDGSMYSYDNITNISNSTNKSNTIIDVLPINNEEQYATFEMQQIPQYKKEEDDKSYVNRILSFQYIKKCHIKYWWLNILIVLILLLIFTMLIYNLYPRRKITKQVFIKSSINKLSLPSQLSTTSPFTL